MITQQQLLSSLLTHPPMKAGAVGLILQICCWRHFVMAQEVFGTKISSVKLKGDFCLSAMSAVDC